MHSIARTHVEQQRAEDIHSAHGHLRRYQREAYLLTASQVEIY
jgi:hypothetical protein